MFDITYLQHADALSVGQVGSHFGLSPGEINANPAAAVSTIIQRAITGNRSDLQPTPVASRVQTIQGDMQPLAPVEKGDLPSYGQLVRSLSTLFGETSFPAKLTDKFGPYTPERIPIWVLKLMRRDGVIRLGLKALKAPLNRASRYYLEGGDPEVRAFHYQWLRRLLPKLLRTGLNCLDYGFSPHEIVFDENLPTINTTYHSGGKRHNAQIRRAVVPRRILDIDPECCEIIVDPVSFKYIGLRVWLSPIYSNMSGIEPLPDRRQFCPGSKTFITSHEMEYGNIRGTAHTLPAYNPWWYGNVADLSWGRFLERIGAGVYKGTAPAQLRPDGRGKMQNPVEYIHALIQAIKSMGAVSIPYEGDPNTKQNKFSIELMEPRNTGETFEKYSTFNRSMKLVAVLCPPKLFFSDGRGSYSGGEIAFEQFFSWVEAYGEEDIEEPINQQLLEPMTAYNFPKGTEAPRIRCYPMSPNLRKQLLDVYKSVTGMLWESKDKDGGPGRINAGQLADVEKMLRAVGVPVREPNDIPVDWDTPPGFAAPSNGDGEGFTDDGKTPKPDGSNQAMKPPANSKPMKGKYRADGASKRGDMSMSDADKNGDKTPTDERR